MNTVIQMNGRAWEMQPLGPQMTAEVQKLARRRAIEEFLETARACGLPFDQINAQLRFFNSAINADELMTPLALADLLFLRTKHDKVTESDARAVPTAELLLHQREIMGLPELKEEPEDLLIMLGIDPDEPEEDAQKQLHEVLEGIAKKKGAARPLDQVAS